MFSWHLMYSEVYQNQQTKHSVWFESKCYPFSRKIYRKSIWPVEFLWDDGFSVGTIHTRWLYPWVLTPVRPEQTSNATRTLSIFVPSYGIFILPEPRPRQGRGTNGFHETLWTLSHYTWTRVRVATFQSRWNSLCFPWVFPVLDNFSLCHF